MFIAAELPEGLVEALAETQAALRQCVSGRYVGHDLFHVTLAFLGDIDPWRIGDLSRMLDVACSAHAPFDARLGELGYFGRMRKAALWQGFADKAPFAALAESVRARLKREGIPFDNKGFLPHVTLMRNADVSTGELPMPTVAQGTVDTVCLFKSDLSGERPAYEALHRAFLEPLH